jgi:phage antirepressor YoqD-like protein
MTVFIIKPEEKWQKMGEVAKQLGWGKNKLFKLLRDNKVFDAYNEPYQEYTDLKYFKTHIKPREYQRWADLVVLVSKRGLNFIKELIETLDVTPDMISLKNDRRDYPSIYKMV